MNLGKHEAHRLSFDCLAILLCEMRENLRTSSFGDIDA